MPSLVGDIEKHDKRIIPQKRFLSFLLGGTPPPIPTEEERISYPFRKVNFFNRIFFVWCIPLLSVGYKRTLDPDDLFRVDGDLSTEYLSDKFDTIFERRLSQDLSKYMKKNNIDDTPENRLFLTKDPTSNFKYSNNILLWSLFETFKHELISSMVFKFLGDISNCLNPLIIRALIAFVHSKANGEDPYIGKGVGYAIGTSSLVAFAGINYANFYHDSAFIGALLRTMLTKVLLSKSLKLNAKSKHQFSEGSITSMIGGDLSRLDLAASYICFSPMIPMCLIIALVLLIVYLGVASISGLGVFLLIAFGIAYTTKPLVRLRKRVNIFTDGRVKYVKEVLNNMKIIKYYSWEIPYGKLVTQLRSDELKEMLDIQFLRNIVAAIALSTTAFSTMVGFLSMFGATGMKSAASIFSSLSLFNILSIQIMLFPTAMSSSSDAYVACNRIQEYLLSEEIEADPDYHLTEDVKEDSEGNALVVSNASFKWESFDYESETEVKIAIEEHIIDSSDQSGTSASSIEKKLGQYLDEPITFEGLHDINLKIKRGEFIVITGLIGSGKSSLLSALVGQMKRLTGSLDVYGSILLCGTPWIQNATVKYNISFGEEFDEEKYNTVVEACSLTSDFEILPAGDRTEIGERGINLSGGQKARLNLARAVYKNSDIILFDDVLSAVDARVGKHIMQHCFMDLLKDKTRILATHQLSLIGTADRIIFLNGDGTIDVGTQEELIQKNKKFNLLMQFQQEGQKTEEDEEEDAQLEEEREIEEDQEVHQQELELIRKQTASNEANEDEDEDEDEAKAKKLENDGILIQKEFRSVNAISSDVFKTYFRAGSGMFGLGIVPIIIFCIALTSFTYLFVNVWLSFWSLDKYSSRSPGFYIGLYVMFVFAFVICATLQFCLIVYTCNNASKNLNIKALLKLLHAPMSFLDTTPMGRIMNRFTKDTDVLDNEIAEQFRLFSFGAGSIVGIYILCIIYMPYFAISLPFIGGMATVIFSFYQASSREVKRIEGIERSNVYSNFNEVLQGNETIKMYKLQTDFVGKNNRLSDRMNESYFLSNSLQRWLAIALHGVSAIINFVITILCVVQVFPISAASAGLVVSYTNQISMMLITTMKAITMLENCLSSVERICEYAIGLPQEAAYEANQGQGKIMPPTPKWPEHGRITFDKVSMTYRPGLPLVLKNINAEVKSMEKIGICGRTGAGKSSIMTALYRLSEIEQDGGEILIDDVNTFDLGLHDLRAKLSIIPQDPVLFRGTIRHNLDPFKLVSDAELYDALRRSGIVEDANDVSATHKFHLDKQVDDDGINFSLGERQLLSLARALVRGSKILIMDEATSSVDYETDSKIQTTIKNEFSHCTILCIAHRLKTILNYDRIMVLDKGEIIQFDEPLKLYNDKNGIFRQMCDRSNITEGDF